MKKKASPEKKSILAVIAACIACVLISSFSIHAVQADHVHPGEQASFAEHAAEEGDGIMVLSEYLHGTEKKLFIFALLGFLLAGAFIGFSMRTAENLLQLWLFFFKKHFFGSSSAVSFRIFDYLQSLFRLGILHTKAF